jgi:hypothetical protein
MYDEPVTYKMPEPIYLSGRRSEIRGVPIEQEHLPVNRHIEQSLETNKHGISCEWSSHTIYKTNVLLPISIHNHRFRYARTQWQLSQFS